MRIAIASLILAAGLAGAVQAQVPATQPAAPAATPTAPAPDAAAPPAAPAAPVAAPAEAAPPPPTLPTEGTGAAVLQVLEKICIPAVRGQSLDALAKGMRLKNNRRDGTWTMALGGDKAYVIIVQPQYSQKDVCRAEIRYPIGEDKPIVSALNVWSFLHQPELILQANYVNTDPDGVKRVRKSWEALQANASTAVNFTVERTAADAPLGKNYDRGQLYYQERKF
jgi:hypothetical protein